MHLQQANSKVPCHKKLYLIPQGVSVCGGECVQQGGVLFWSCSWVWKHQIGRQPTSLILIDPHLRTESIWDTVSLAMWFSLAARSMCLEHNPCFRFQMPWVEKDTCLLPFSHCKIFATSYYKLQYETVTSEESQIGFIVKRFPADANDLCVPELVGRHFALPISLKTHTHARTYTHTATMKCSETGQAATYMKESHPSSWILRRHSSRTAQPCENMILLIQPNSERTFKVIHGVWSCCSSQELPEGSFRCLIFPRCQKMPGVGICANFSLQWLSCI